MPKKFDAELLRLKEKIITMGEKAQEMFQTAMKALVNRDPSPGPEIQKLEEVVDRYQVEIDEDVVRLMATYGPVALDLRFVLMVARINTELERIGDQAVNMCENVELLLSEPELKKLVDLPRMADVAARMLRQSLQAFREESIEKAQEVIRADDEVDALNDQIFRELLTYMLSDPRTITRSVALVLTARMLERIADHATNIAEEVIYMVKGVDVRHQEALKHAKGGKV
jgi:phosphate transport system protein